MLNLGNPRWTRDEMRRALDEFMGFYGNRPIKDNFGGMRAPHMFLAWFTAKILQPKAIIESGIWHGQGTWILEKACPRAELHCIDPNLKRIEYRSARARYYEEDFKVIDWSGLPKAETLLFFDDHQNAYERLKSAHWFGFKHLMFEDNYPAGRGDCYSLKKAWMGAGHCEKKSALGVLSGAAKIVLGRPWSSERVPPNGADAVFLRQNLEIYEELPPVYKTELTRWGDRWDDAIYPTPKPLLSDGEVDDKWKVFVSEAGYYTWMCYAKLK